MHSPPFDHIETSSAEKVCNEGQANSKQPRQHPWIEKKLKHNAGRLTSEPSLFHERPGKKRSPKSKPTDSELLRAFGRRQKKTLREKSLRVRVSSPIETAGTGQNLPVLGIKYPVPLVFFLVEVA